MSYKFQIVHPQLGLSPDNITHIRFNLEIDEEGNLEMQANGMLVAWISAISGKIFFYRDKDRLKAIGLPVNPDTEKWEIA